jgi:R3H domain
MDELIPSQVKANNGVNSMNQSNTRSRAKNNSRRRTNLNDGESKLESQTASGETSEIKKKNQNRRRPKGKKTSEGVVDSTKSMNPSGDSVERTSLAPENKTKAPKKRKPKGNLYPWRKFLSDACVDPITLEPLKSLRYPPFALCADTPYIPVKIWPVPTEEKDEKLETEEERQKRIIEEQWGSIAKTADSNNIDKNQTIPLSMRKFNLFDGRALAYYMVSQLQFIDPLNRRDLTRDELLNLDQYLKRSGFHDLNVTDTYDAKGITVSSAGANGGTAEGRALIRQQEAQQLAQSLLNNLFAGASVTSLTNSLQAQYAASQRQSNSRRQRSRRRDGQNDGGIYGSEEAGLVVIDDDENPGLRDYNGLPNADAPIFTPGSNWSGSQFLNHSESIHYHNFPALERTNTSPVSSQPQISVKDEVKKNVPSGSLAKISKVIKKTSEKELKKQREARELFIKRAAISQLQFGVERPEFKPIPTFTQPTTELLEGPSEGKLLRNQALASALGVAPSTVRTQKFKEGWARPTGQQYELDEFGNELNAASYPDTLILQARERMTFLLKLEKKWINFLSDDTSASLPLNKMDRPLRTFVHAYSDFWKLNTQSFDPEPNRYIHCVKLRDTCAPRPLLSEAARNWRGPSKPLAGEMTDHEVIQTAGQTPREFPTVPREPLQLKSRSQDPSPLEFRISKAESEAVVQQENSRSVELFLGRERPKLELAPRTIPIDCPSASKAQIMMDERKRFEAMQEKKHRIAREKEEEKRKLLESIYASEDDEKSVKSHDSEEWNGLDDQEVCLVDEDEGL